MSSDIAIIKELEKEIGIEIKHQVSDPEWDSTACQIDYNKKVLALSLYSIKLKRFPKTILSLKNLKKLNLYDNAAVKVPSEIWHLSELSSFAYIGIRLPPLPKGINQLKKLIELRLVGTDISSLFKEICQIINLELLELAYNQIEQLPKEIEQLINLKNLFLHGNLLTKLPIELTKLNRLKSLALEENPLKQPPPEIAEQGVKAIFEYLRQLPEEPEQIINEAKLILVGQGDVGKTCLANRLIHNTFENQKTTEGIDILSWQINAPTEENDEIMLNIWDFGGQEIYHATHQFFLTKRSVYILVWNARKSKDYDHIDYWLHTVEAFGGDSPVILVMSKKHERDDDLNMKDLREKFPNIVGLYKVDNLDGFGISQLKEIIREQAWALPHMQTPWVNSWLKVREKLEKDERNWINYNEFVNVCKTEDLNKKQMNILDEYLHDLGIIIHFRDRLQLNNMVVLNPEWATDAVYKVLDTQSVRDNDGVLHHNELEKIWDPNDYPSELRSKLLELMERFELAYELPDKTSHLVTELLPSTEPDFKWNDKNNLRFYYRYDFLPAGVMPRFIVLVHQDLELRSKNRQLCWREGAVLKRNGMRAFVKVHRLVKTIEIRIDGQNKRELLAIIRREFDHINKSIKKVKIVPQIPCNCSASCIHRFDYVQLLKAEQIGKASVECPQTWDEVSLSKLLDGYEKKKERVKEAERISRGQGDVYIQVSPQQTVTQKATQIQKSKQEVKIDIDIKVDLPEIQNDFEQLKELVIKVNPAFEEQLEKIGDSLDEVSSEDSKKELKKPLNKLGRFLKKLEDENSDFHKAIRGTQKGIELAQKVGKKYNKFAQWLALPQVPDLFLGK